MAPPAAGADGPEKAPVELRGEITDEFRAVASTLHESLLSAQKIDSRRAVVQHFLGETRRGLSMCSDELEGMIPADRTVARPARGASHHWTA